MTGIDESGTWRELNRAWWHERVALHASSAFYDLDGFRSGKAVVEPFEVHELGPLEGRLAHLQCHFGLDTLDLVRMHPTLEAVGLDFSAPAIETATQLATEVGLADRARFVTGDIYDATATLEPASFDVVYTGKGALEWLPDVTQWAETVAQLLRPGGVLYLVEFHPAAWTLADEGPQLAFDYFQREPFVDEAPGSYAEPAAATTHNVTYEWLHTVSAVLDAVLGAGLRLQFFHEWDYTLFEAFPWLVADGPRRWRFPGPGSLPLMYSLRAQRPIDR